MGILAAIIFFITLFVLEIIYFKIADKYNIIDHPNHRSSHTKVTIRGGGIIFPVAFLLASAYCGWRYSYFLVGLLMISTISFMDDIRSVSKKLRIIFHLTAVALLFYQLNAYHIPFYGMALAFIFIIGTINAVNFMDGINGITGGYALVALLTLYYINQKVVNFTDEQYLIAALLSVVVFNFFNFRKKALCFAGDVGSVSIAFIIVFFLLQLIIKTENASYLLLLLIYYTDTATTIFFRLIRKENILEAHRSHFYQYLANEKKMPHLLVTLMYMLIQILINAIILNFLPSSLVIVSLIMVFSLLLLAVVRLFIEGKQRLMHV